MRTANVLVLASLFFVPSVCPAEPPPAAQPAQLSDAAAILTQSRQAIAALKAFSYSAKTFGTGALAGKVPAYTAEVSAAKSEDNYWRLYTKGKADAPDAQPFEIGYDGLDARAIREKDKAVVEKSVENMADLAVFMSTQSARHPIAWELFGDPALPGDAAAAKSESAATIGAVPCDVITLPAVTGNDDAPGGLRIFIAKSDHLPRKIERLQAPDKPGESAKSARVLELTDFKVDADAAPGTFAISIPNGYRVKAAEANKPKKPLDDPKGKGDGDGAGNNGLLAIGKPAPDWELKDSEGKKHKLSECKGKPVLMDFWATWCGPCKMAMPGIQKIHEKYKDKIHVFGMNMSESGDPAAYMEKKGFDYTLILKADDAANDYKVTGIPCFYLIDADGKILFTSVGFAPQMEKTLEEKIDAALAEKK